jgi:hypothetical protein
MINWYFNPDYRGTAAQTCFQSIEATFGISGQRVAESSLSEVIRMKTGDRNFFVKRYSGNGKSALRRWFGLRGFIGPQRVKKEWQNLTVFRKFGIPTATLVGYGLERRYGCFVRGALITEEIPGTVDLAALSRMNDGRLRDRGWVNGVSNQIAEHVSRLHAAGFVHNDLKWRNLLVNNEKLPTVYWIDCPAGGYWCGAFLRYRIVKDLACLDKLGKRHLSRTQRLRFYLAYRQRDRLCVDDKKMVRKITGFFEGRE